MNVSIPIGTQIKSRGVGAVPLPPPPAWLIMTNFLALNTIISNVKTPLKFR